jgi:hypothetical protein
MAPSDHPFPTRLPEVLMSSFPRRTTRAAAVLVATGTTIATLAAPALAAPAGPAATTTNCAAPVDGVTVCFNSMPDPANPDLRLIWGTAATDAGHTIAAGLLTVEACSGYCNPSTAIAANNTTGFETEKIYWGRGTGYYRINASWADTAHHSHYQVTCTA